MLLHFKSAFCHEIIFEEVVQVPIACTSRGVAYNGRHYFEKYLLIIGLVKGVHVIRF